MATVRPAALRAIGTGRVTVLSVKLDAEWKPARVVAAVRSSSNGHRYRVQLRAGTWCCTCRDGLRGEDCSHVQAVALVTRPDGAARTA